MGTFDISILDIGDGVVEVKSTNGDVNLGGANIDLRVIDWLNDEFKSEFKIDLKKDSIALQRLKEAAEKAKIELSSTTSTEINLPYITIVDNQPKHLVKTLTRAKFEQLIEPELKRLEKPCIQAISDSGFDKNEINEVILVGGSTRMPIIETIVEKLFGKKPTKSLNPDLCVAEGASIQCSVLTGEVDDILLLDVTPFNISIETMGGVATTMIESNSTIPIEKEQVFSTASDNQHSVQINICQGNRPMFKDNKLLGSFTLDGIPPAPRGIPQIAIKLNMNSNGILEVSAVDKGTGKQQHITISNSSTLSDDEVNRMKKEAEDNYEADKKIKEETEKLNQADALIFSTEKQIKDLESNFINDEKEQLNSKLDDLKKAKDSKNFNDIDKFTNELTEIWNKISTRIYQNTQQPQPGQTQPDQSAKPDDSTQDVEFEEVEK